MKKFLLIIFAIFIFSNTPLLNSSDMLVVGVWNNPPLSTIQDGKITGFVPDIFRYIAEKEGINFTFVEDSWDSLYKKIEDGEIDILLPIGFSKEREKIMNFNNEDIFINWGKIIVRTDSNIRSIIDLEGKSIAVKQNDIFLTGNEALLDILKSFKINSSFTYGKDYPEITSLVSSNKADAGLISRIYYPYIDKSNITTSSIILKPIEVRIAFSKKVDKTVIEKLDHSLILLKKDPSSIYNQMLNNLLKTNSPFSWILLNVLYFFIILFIISIIFLIILRFQINKKTLALELSTQKALENENKMKSIISAMPENALLLDKNGKYIDIFSNQDKLFGQNKDDLFGKTVSEILPQNISSQFLHCINDAITNKTLNTLCYKIDNIDGRSKYFQGRFVPVEIFEDNKKVEYALSLLVDITERKILENELKDEKDKLNTILKSIMESVVVLDKSLNIIFCNKAAENMLGKKLEELIGKDFNEVIKLQTIDGNDYYIPFDDIIERGLMGYIITNCKLIKENGDYIIIEDSVAPLYNAQSDISGVVFVFSDVTQKKNLEMQILKNQKLEALGILAAGIAHDFNNYLGAITSYFELFKLKFLNSSYKDINLLEIEELIEPIGMILGKSKSLTQQLLTFSKGGSPIKKPEDPKKLLTDISKLLVSGTSININYHFNENVKNIEIDYDQFSQVISNIIINAKEALRDKGEINISVDNLKLTIKNNYYLPEGEYVEIKISDNGPGIPQSIIEKIFDPFFTTKDTGSGLGLSICHSIVTKHHGKIFVNSTEKGTEFKIILRATDKEIISENSSSTSIDISKTDLKILYLEDEAMLRESFSLLLNEFGCTVTAVENGEQVLEIYDKSKFDFAVFDLTIKKGMGGIDTAKILLEKDNDAYIVVTSGYSEDDAIAYYQKYGFKDYLIKPYKITDITKLLERYQNWKRGESI